MVTLILALEASEGIQSKYICPLMSVNAVRTCSPERKAGINPLRYILGVYPRKLLFFLCANNPEQISIGLFCFIELNILRLKKIAIEGMKPHIKPNIVLEGKNRRVVR